MPFTVITLKSVPESLRGDLTKWMQEIDTGVYVGNFNSRIREYLWKRVCRQVGNGEATMSFACRNEVGYDFNTINTRRKVIDFDGLPLVLDPAVKDNSIKLQKGFSNAAKMMHARKKLKAGGKEQSSGAFCVPVQEKKIKTCIFLDIETTGLRTGEDRIIEIGAVKYEEGKKTDFHKLICIGSKLPDRIVQLTGITDQMLERSDTLKEALKELLYFISGYVLVGYNIGFDLKFLNAGLQEYGMPLITNQTIDLIQLVKKEKIFLTDYKLETVLKAYGINENVPHRALQDATLLWKLSSKVNIFWQD